MATKAPLIQWGRPPKLVLTDELLMKIQGLALLMCNNDEIATFLHVSRNTFYRFAAKHKQVGEAIERGQGEFKIGLRREQIRHAKKNPGMAMYLGKVYLGQKEYTPVEISGPGGGPIRTENLNFNIDLNKMTYEQLKALEPVIAQLAATQRVLGPAESGDSEAGR